MPTISLNLLFNKFIYSVIFISKKGESFVSHEELLKFFAWCKTYVKLSNFCIDLGISQGEFSKYMNDKRSSVTDVEGRILYNYICTTLSNKIT